MSNNCWQKPLPGQALRPEKAHIPGPGDSEIGILLPEEASRIIDSWRILFDPNYYALPPHITLFWPVNIKEENRLDVIRDIRRELNSVEPFNLSFSGLDEFESPTQVLWLRPTLEKALIKLREAVMRALSVSCEKEKYPFQPHLTIGYFNSPPAMAAARRCVERELTQESMKMLECTVDKVYYMTIDDGYAWKVRNEIPLYSVQSSS